MVDDLVLPISEDAPCGEYLKLNKTEYRALRNSYNNALSSFRQLTETPDNCQNDELIEKNDENWATFSSLAKNALINKTKDIEILCWYITAQIFTRNHVDNMAMGFEVLLKWLELFWNDLNPKIAPAVFAKLAEDKREQASIEAKLLPLMQFAGDSLINCSLYAPIQIKSLIGEITFGDYITASANGNLPSLRNDAGEYFNSNISDLILSVNDIIFKIQKVELFIRDKCKEVGVIFNLNFLKEVFGSILLAIKDLIGDRLQPWPLDPVRVNNGEVSNNIDEGSDNNELNSNTIETNVSSDNKQINKNNQNMSELSQNSQNISNLNNDSFNASSLNHRNDAFSQLKLIADYFRSNEPHSPVPYLIERAIRWGYLSLPELITELISDNNVQVIDQIKLITGMDNLSAVPVIPKTETKEDKNLTVSSDKNVDTSQKPKITEQPESVEKVKEKAKPKRVEQSIFD